MSIERFALLNFYTNEFALALLLLLRCFNHFWFRFVLEMDYWLGGAEVENLGALCVGGQVSPFEVGVESVDPELLLVIVVGEESVITLVGPEVKAINPFFIWFLTLNQCCFMEMPLAVIHFLLVVDNLVDVLHTS